MLASKFDKNKELIVGIIMIVFGSFYLYSTRNIKGLDTVKIDADFMPRIYGILSVILGVIQFYIGIIGRRKYRKTEVEELIDNKNVLFTFLVIIAYVLILKPVGFIISSILFLFTMSIILTPGYMEKNYIRYLVFSILLSLITYFIFKKLMYIALPSGIFSI